MATRRVKISEAAFSLKVFVNNCLHNCDHRFTAYRNAGGKILLLHRYRYANERKGHWQWDTIENFEQIRVRFKDHPALAASAIDALVSNLRSRGVSRAVVG